MLSTEQRIAQARALSTRASIERMPPLEFLAFAEWLGLSDAVDRQVGAEADNTQDPRR
jgi:hypothetical protein